MRRDPRPPTAAATKARSQSAGLLGLTAPQKSTEQTVSTGRLRLGLYELSLDQINPTLYHGVTVAQYRHAKRTAWVRFIDAHTTGRIKQYVGAYSHPDAQVEEWVNSEMIPVIRRALGPLLSGARYWGQVLVNLRWEQGNNGLRLAPLYIARPEQWWYGRPRRDEASQELIGWWLQTINANVDFRNASGYREVAQWAPSTPGEPWGEPICMTVYPHATMLARHWQAESVGGDAAAIPRTIYPSHDAFTPGGEGDKIVNAHASLGANGAMALPPELVTGIRELGTAFGTGQSPWGEPRQGHVEAICAAYGLPNLSVTSKLHGGSLAQAKEHGSTADEDQMDVAQRLVDELLIPQIVAEGIRLQYGPNCEYGGFDIAPISKPDLAQEAQMVESLSRSGAINMSNPEHLDWVGAKFGIPMEREMTMVTHIPGPEVGMPPAETRPQAGGPPLTGGEA